MGLAEGLDAPPGRCTAAGRRATSAPRAPGDLAAQALFSEPLLFFFNPRGQLAKAQAGAVREFEAGGMADTAAVPVRASKRARRQASKLRFAEEEVASRDEERELMQALKISRRMAESVASGADKNFDALVAAPVFHPTEEEFALGPAAYAASIRDKAEQYGICRIVPPASWKPPTERPPETRKLETKFQEINAMSEGHFFGEGKLYTASEYEAMAKAFEKTWDESHARSSGGRLAADGSGLCEPLGDAERARAFERWFWDVVDTEAETLNVEYANDLNTASAFPKSGEYSTHPWNLNNIPHHETSLLRFMGEQVPGIDAPWVYLGMRFSTFCWHTEDNWMYSINYNHTGAPKLWYGVPGSAAPLLERAMKEAIPSLFEADPALLHKLVTLMPPTRLKSFGVPVVTTRQRAGEFIITFPRSYHAGFNEGFNMCEAVNFAPVDWLPWGGESRTEYQKISRPSFLRFEDMLFHYAAFLKNTSPNGIDSHVGDLMGAQLRNVLREETLGREAACRDGTVRSRRVRGAHLGADSVCVKCKTPLCMSAIVASESLKIGAGGHKVRMTCVQHGAALKVPPAERTMLYTHDLGELGKATAGFLGEIKRGGPEKGRTLDNLKVRRERRAPTPSCGATRPAHAPRSRAFAGPVELRS